MRGSRALLRLRAHEIVGTWRIWILPAVMILLAVSSPVMARFTHEILAATIGAAQAEAIGLPDPTAIDAYAQWTKNLTQLVVLLVVVMAAGAINTEVRSGVAGLLLVKPASRTAYVLTHALALIVFVGTVALVGACLSWAVTLAVFGSAPLGPLLAATGVWLVLMAVLVSAALLASVAIDAVPGAAGVGIGAFLLLAILGAVPAVAAYTPAGLIQMTSAVAAGTQAADHTLWWPVVTGLVLTVALLAAGVAVFQRKEL